MRRSAKKEKRRKRQNLIASLIMIFLMAGSIIIISFDSIGNTDSFEYNGFTFKQEVIFDDQLYLQEIIKYSVEVEKGEIQTFFLPTEMNKINVSENNIDALRTANQVLFSRKPLSEDAEFNQNMIFFDYLRMEYAKNSFKNTGFGLTKESIYESEHNIINCETANQNTMVFILSRGTSELSIKEKEPYCFEISGRGDELLFVSDYLLYKTHGVI